jgi:hypothetical protein
VANAVSSDWTAAGFTRRQLRCQVADGGAFRVTDFDRAKRALLRQLGEELVAAGAAEDVDAV